MAQIIVLLDDSGLQLSRLPSSRSNPDQDGWRGAAQFDDGVLPEQSRHGTNAARIGKDQHMILMPGAPRALGIYHPDAPQSGFQRALHALIPAARHSA
jgi:hypothetical protein